VWCESAQTDAPLQYANSGVDSHMGLYLAALPTNEERNPDGTWTRVGQCASSFPCPRSSSYILGDRFCFDLKGTDGSTFRSMEAQDHCFASENVRTTFRLHMRAQLLAVQLGVRASASYQICADPVARWNSFWSACFCGRLQS
jgi:hypothetical protein